MKIRLFKICMAVTCLCLLLSACGRESDTAIREYSYSTEKFYSDKAEPTSEPLLCETYDENLTEQALKHYQEVYSAKAVFSDLYVSQKYLMIGKDTIVELLLINGYSQTKEIRRENIERVECKALTDLCRIELFDKTNESLSITVNEETAKEITALLQPKDTVKEDIPHE